MLTHISEETDSKHAMKETTFHMQLGQIELSIPELLKDYPPQYSFEKKRFFYEKALARHTEAFTDPVPLKVTQSACQNFSTMQFSLTSTPLSIQTDDRFFEYDDLSDEHKRVWYMNFAAPNVFSAYGSQPFVQDEIQALEHPLLGSVARYLKEKNDLKLSYRLLLNGEPRPIAIENVPYWIHVNTNPIDADGKPHSIYGYHFARSDMALLEKGITIREESTKNNIIAMCAPLPGFGPYVRIEIEQILCTTIAGFSTCIDGDKKTVIHTGRWGAGAFGGSEELALLVQMLGGALTGVDTLVFHAVTPDAFQRAEKHFRNAQAQNYTTTRELVEFIGAQKYHWTCRNGN